jgi:hypothetical protein
VPSSDRWTPRWSGNPSGTPSTNLGPTLSGLVFFGPAARL